MESRSATIRLGDEFDEALRDALRVALTELGASFGSSAWGVGGSQEVETVDVTVGDQRVTILAETYVGLTITGDDDIVRRVAAQVSAVLARS